MSTEFYYVSGSRSCHFRPHDDISDFYIPINIGYMFVSVFVFI